MTLVVLALLAIGSPCVAFTWWRPRWLRRMDELRRFPILLGFIGGHDHVVGDVVDVNGRYFRVQCKVGASLMVRRTVGQFFRDAWRGWSAR